MLKRRCNVSRREERKGGNEMSDTQRTRSPHAKLEEFIDCFLNTNHKEELESFTLPHLARPTREEAPDEALRYLALVLLYGLNQRVKDISFVRKQPGRMITRMSGDKFYDVPAPKEEVAEHLFEEIEEMAGIDGTKRNGKLVVGIKNDQVNLKISSLMTDADEEKILIQLPKVG
jgi:hypothetical protein